jgi:hypothetical protein
MTLSCSSSPVTASFVPLWESDPDQFWGEVVRRVTVGRNADGQQFVTASWRGRTATFPLADVREHVEKYFELVDRTPAGDA